MATHTIFYSWQSDLPNPTNRSFIEDCLQRAIKEVRADDELKLDPCLDRDTSGVPGSPDIAATIFDKIKAADIFVGDVSFINQGATGRPTPNPNVLVELGYAAGLLGWDQIICVFNEATGDIHELPFDIRPRRVTAYELAENQEKAEQRKALVNVLTTAIITILHAPNKAAQEGFQQFVSTLASELISVIIFGNKLEDRTVDPWSDSHRDQLDAVADTLGHMATSDTAIRHSMTTELEELANSLDETANVEMHSWPEFDALFQAVVEKATAIKQARIDGVPLSEESLAAAKGTIITVQRRLERLAARAKAMGEQGRSKVLQSESSEFGDALFRVGHHNIDAIQPGLTQKMRRIGRNLQMAETMGHDYHGDRFDRAMVDLIRQNSAELAELVKSLSPIP